MLNKRLLMTAVMTAAAETTTSIKSDHSLRQHVHVHNQECIAVPLRGS